MKTIIKVLIVLAIIILASFLLLTHCVRGEIYGDPAKRAERIYEEKSDNLYEIIEFLNNTGVSEITYGYVDIEGSSELTSEQEEELNQIHKFMSANMIDAIQKYNFRGDTHISFTVRHGWCSIAFLEYCPQKTDIKGIKKANYCNGWYIDDSWIVLDYQDENYW